MFVAQGTAQWEIWTGQRAPVAAMRKAVEDALKQSEKATRDGSREKASSSKSRTKR
jgi:hypothetical protein